MSCKPMPSQEVPSHVHTCQGGHDSPYCKCSDPSCRRYFHKS